ncbi:MAG: hypothetical protein RLZ98_1314 [Pseudomonadota bacterium]|jgi:hypothetical protein
MASNFHERFDEGALKLPSDRSTGLVFAGMAALVAWLWRDNESVLAVSSYLALALVSVSLILPSMLHPLNRAWMKFAMLLGRVVNPVVMLVLFLLVIVPAGLIMQIFRDPMRLRQRDKSDSHWIARDPEQVQDMRNQF